MKKSPIDKAVKVDVPPPPAKARTKKITEALATITTKAPKEPAVDAFMRAMDGRQKFLRETANRLDILAERARAMGNDPGAVLLKQEVDDIKEGLELIEVALEIEWSA